MTKPLNSTAAATASDDLTDFDPAPVKPRHDGWTAERQRAFIAALAEQGCVSDACRAVGVSPRSAYRLRRRAGAEAFDAAWEAALTIASHRLTSIAFERAVHGAVRRVWRDGELVLEERKVSDRLLIFLLTHFDPMRYGVLSGFTPVAIRDPRESAREKLPAVLDMLSDSDEPAEPLAAPGRAIEDGEPSRA